MTVTTSSESEPDKNTQAVLQEASNVIESEQENIKIEIVFNKAVRVGVMLVEWRKMMINGEFTVDWVEDAANNIFQTFFPPPYDVTTVYAAAGDDGDDD